MGEVIEKFSVYLYQSHASSITTDSDLKFIGYFNKLKNLKLHIRFKIQS